MKNLEMGEPRIGFNTVEDGGWEEGATIANLFRSGLILNRQTHYTTLQRTG